MNSICPFKKILDVVRRHENKTTLEFDIQSDNHVLLIGNAGMEMKK